MHRKCMKFIRTLNFSGKIMIFQCCFLTFLLAPCQSHKICAIMSQFFFSSIVLSCCQIPFHSDDDGFCYLYRRAAQCFSALPARNKKIFPIFFLCCLLHSSSTIIKTIMTNNFLRSLNTIEHFSWFMFLLIKTHTYSLQTSENMAQTRKEFQQQGRRRAFYLTWEFLFRMFSMPGIALPYPVFEWNYDPHYKLCCGRKVQWRKTIPHIYVLHTKDHK